jgi:glycyl-tRNA synthetase
MPADRIDSIVSLAKRRGFVYPSSEIYGGTRSAWDYGPLGVELKENVRRQWWRSMVQQRDDIVGIDSAVILARDVWAASGHLDAFVDPLTECQSCHKRFRADHLEEAYEAKHGSMPSSLQELNCPNCGNKGTFTEPKMFNGLMKTYLGPTESDEGLHYLRPETAQGIFVNYNNVATAARKKPPFGIAQVGKSFRNEITPGNFIFRTREFEQMEMEFFVEPGTDAGWYEYWLEERWNWYIDLGLNPDNLRFYEHPKEKLSHYSERTVDIEYDFPFRGWSELEGIANRTDYDLKQHAAFSGENLTYFDQATGKSYVPYVIEPASGPDRIMLAFLVDAYREEEVRGETRTVLKLHPRLAPTKAAVFPLTKKEPVASVARELYDDLKGEYRVFYDDSGAIGRRYRRQDEAGTPFCVTVDFDTLEDRQVTVRDRDTMEQERIPLDAVREKLRALIYG